MTRAKRMMRSGKLAALCMATLLVASCAIDPVPAAFQGLSDQEMASALSDTTALYQTRNQMHFEYYGADGEFKEWANNRDFLISGTWSVSNGDICQHIHNSEDRNNLDYCKANSEKLKDLAAIFSGDVLYLSGREFIFCQMNYRTISQIDGSKPHPESTVLALSAAAALRDQDNEEFANKNCSEYVYGVRDDWYINDQEDASKILEETKYYRDGIMLIDMAKFETIAPNYLTSAGIRILRRYFIISNSITKKAYRPMKFSIF